MPGPERLPGGLRAPLPWLLLLSQPSQARVFCQPQVPLAAGQGAVGTFNKGP